MATIPNIPQPKSYDQILGDMIAEYASQTGIPSISVGGPSLSFFKVAALAISRASGSVFQTLLNSNLAYATTSSLQAIAAEFGIIPTVSAVSTGFVTVTDTSFDEVFTTTYPGANAVNQGSVVIYGSSNTGFPVSGSIYIGRGTNNSEGPIAYTSITPIGNYFQFNLSSPTQKFHNISETIILAQGGNRTVPVNAVVIAPSNGLEPDLQYTVTQMAIILDGQVSVSNVPITALVPGSSGNVPSNSISQFAANPFPNATVSNPIATSGGTDPQTDDQLRVQIQLALSSIGLGTSTAIKNSLIGLTASDETGTIQSDSLVNNLDGSSTVYIGTGGIPYEAKTAGVAIEHIVDSAVGGERFFQLQTGGTQAPVAKAFIQTSNSSPFAISEGMVLAVTVGGITTQHSFLDSDFQAPGAATAYEICASINADTSLNFEATTSGGGVLVVLRAIAETNESIQISTPSSPTLVDANDFMAFPNTLNETLRLYKDGVLLSQDGQNAFVLSQQQSLWSPSIADGDTLILSVDGTAQITYTILNSDFIATGLYTTVNATNSLASWAEVFNNKITGITATVVGTSIEITSNVGRSSRAQIVIDPSSTLVTNAMFSSSIGLSSQGSPSDYVLDRNTAQFELTTALSEGDILTAGTQNTKGTITSSQFSGTTINFTDEGYIWIAIDEPVEFIETGVTAGSFLTVSSSTNIVSYQTNTANAFTNVSPGDYVIIWSAELNVNNRLEGRVNSISTTSLTDDTLNIKVTTAEATAVVPEINTVFNSGFVVTRMAYAPQKFNISAGLNTLDFISEFLQAQSDSVIFDVFIEEFITIQTKTLNTNGSITIITADDSGSLLNFTQGQTNNSNYPIIAYQDTQSAYLPAFFHSKITSDTSASPPDSFLTTFTSGITVSGRDPNEIVTFINPYGGIDDEQPVNEVVQETVVSGTSIGITQDPEVRRLRTNDRYFLSSPLSFGNADEVTVVIDNNPSGNTFTIPLFRNALTNTTYGIDANSFNAYDKDFSLTGNFATSFGSTFSFNNYMVLMQAKKTLSSTTLQSSILYRSVKWGSSGEKIIVAYVVSGAVFNNSISIGTNVTITITVPVGSIATDVATYVNSNLQTYITATVVNDGTGGTPGSGVITTNTSTQLLDGLNWISTSDISNSPQFVLKRALSLPSDVGYAFNNGETIQFSPTTYEQVSQYMNILSTSGLTTTSVVNTANRQSILEFSSDTFGSAGYVQVVGGAANGYSFPVLDSALNISNTYCAISASNLASNNVISDQWFFLQAANVQQKQTQLSTNTNVTITPNSPIAGQSTVALANITLSQRYFGKARVIAGLTGLTFRVESQDGLVCFSYVSSTSTPQFLTFPVNFNAGGGGNLSVSLVVGTNDSQITILTGAATFSNINIGDIVTITGLSNSANNGTFIVTGSSSTVLQITNANAVVEAVDVYTGSTFSSTTGVMEGDSIIVGAPFAAPNRGTYRVIRVFNDSFWIENLDVVEEEVVLGANTFKFYEYEATIPGDQLVISGTSIGTTNAGTYPVVSVLSPSSIVVTGVLTSVVALNLTGLLSSFYINEGTAYTGYKHTYLVVPQPGAPSRSEILFDTYLQYQKINQAAGVEVTAIDKLDFLTSISQGLDGYKYNTGLLREANRVVYGDPVDSASYPGVSASGSDIFIREPLVLVVSIAVDVRLQTGSPFSAISQQVQNNIAALVNSNPVGKSIAISSIIAVCTVIPGVVSVAISSPNFSPSNDLITLQPKEQSFILDPSNVSVSLIQ